MNRAAGTLLVALCVACGNEPVVSARLVDPQPTEALDGWPSYLIEVHQGRLAAIPGLDRVWKRSEQVDTIPNVRSLGPVAVVGDTMVIGLGGSPAGATSFQYNLKTKTLTRAPIPDWLHTASFTPPPAFAPQGRHIAYLARDEAGRVRLIVRSWPDGRLIGRSPSAHHRISPPPSGGAIGWRSADRVFAGFPVSDSGRGWARAEGSFTSGSVNLSWTIRPEQRPGQTAPVVGMQVETDTAAFRAETDSVVGHSEAVSARQAKVLNSGDTVVIRASTLIAAIRRTPTLPRLARRDLSALQAHLKGSTAVVRESLASRPIPFRLAVADSFWIATDSGHKLIKVWETNSPAYYLAPRDRPMRSLDGQWSAAEIIGEVDWYLAPTETQREGEWARAARMVKRLPAAAFPELPKAFAAEMEQRGCTVPQSGYTGARGNVIHGSFGAPRQQDWAALCSRNGVSVILVYWGGPAQCPRELQPSPDSDFLQTVGGGRIGFSRGIAATNTVPVIPDEGDTASGDKSLTLEHDAIEDAFEGKASTIWFCRGGKWIALGGAD